MSMFGDLLGTVGGSAAIKNAYDKLGSVGDKALTQGNQIADTTYNRGQFQGYGFGTPGGGNVSIGANGQSTASLGAAGQNWQNQAQGMASSQMGSQPGQAYMDASQQFLGQSMGDPYARQQQMYDQIRAVQAPTEQRMQQATDARLANQGRRGVQSAMFGGGNAESYGMQQAINENMNQAFLNAQQMSQAEQAQQASLAGQYGQMGNQMNTQALQNAIAAQTASYIPEAQMQQWMQAFSPYANIENQSRLQTAQDWMTGRMSGLDAYLGANLGQANLMGQLGSGMLGGVANSNNFGNWFDDTAKTVVDKILN